MRRDRVLVIATGHLGDIVGTLPALRALRASRPEARITLMMNEYASAALEGCPYVDEVVPAFSYRERGRLARLAFQANALRRIVGRSGTAVILRGPPATAPLLALASGARVRSGFSSRGRLRTPAYARRWARAGRSIEPRGQPHPALPDRDRGQR